MKQLKRLGALFAFVAASAGAVVGSGASLAMAANDTSAVADPVQRGAVTVYKYDAEQSKGQPQGGSDLAGATFTITNESDQTVVYYDEHGHKLNKAKGESWDIQVKYQTVIGTNGEKAYVAQTPERALPFGKYHIQETAGSAGYGIATKDAFINHKYVPGYLTTAQKKWVDEGYTFVIDGDGQIVTFTDVGNDKKLTEAVTGGAGKGTAASPFKASAVGGNYQIDAGCYNPLIRGGIEVIKRDHDLLRATPQGGASLEGGTFVIYNANEYPVQVWDHFDQDENGLYHGVVAENYTVNLRSNANVNITLDSEHDSDKYQTSFTGGKVTTQIEDSVTVTDNAGRKFTYDGGGWVKPGGIVAVVQSGDDGRAQTFMDALPVGWYLVVELEAPKGYVREKLWESHILIDNDDWDTNVATAPDDPVLRGGVQVVKRDSSALMQDAEPQGNAKLSGAKVGFFSLNSNDVVIRSSNAMGKGTGDVSGQFEKPDSRIGGTRVSGADYAQGIAYLREHADAAHGLVGIATTNDQGIAELRQLPYGKYVAIELSASNGYELNEDWAFEFTIGEVQGVDATGDTVVASTDKSAAGKDPHETNMLIQDPTRTKSLLKIHKLDAETGENVSLYTNKVFDDVKFTVRNVSEHPVVWYSVDKDGNILPLYDEKGRAINDINALQSHKDAHAYKPGDVIGTFTVDSDYGTVELRNLPYGTYEITEAQAPKGYIRNTDVKTVTISDSSEPETDINFENQIIREDLQFQKVDSDTQKPMAGVGFLLEKLDLDGNVVESHVLVTDEDGMVDTSGDASGNHPWRARMKDGQPHYNLADGYYNPETGEFTYVAPVADKEAVLAELNGDGTEENPGLVKELEDLMAQLDDVLTKANVEGIKTLYDELVQIVREANEIAVTQGDDSADYADKIKEQADKIVEIHEAIAAARAAVGGDYLAKIDELEMAIEAKEAQIKDAQERLAAIDDKLTGDGAIWETGYWFFGTGVDASVEVDEELGALPYGNYRLTELRSEKNQGKKLVSRDVTIKRGHNIIEDLGTINNSSIPTCDPCNDRSVQGLEVEMHKTSTPEPNSLVKPGQDITYTLNYENTSTETVPFMQIRDYVPNSTTFKSAANDGVFVKGENYVEWVIKDVKPGDKGSVSFVVTVDRGADPIIVNQAHYGIYDTEIVAGSGLDDPYGSTNVVKHSTDGTKTGAYLDARKTSEPAAGATVKVGDRITYTIEVTNKGDEEAKSVGVADLIPEYTKIAVNNDESTGYYDVNAISDDGYMVSDKMVGWNLGSLKAGESKTVSFTVEVLDEARMTVRNQASYGITKGKVTGSLDNTTNIVEHEVETLPEITITKSADKAELVSAGEIITYTLHIENKGRGNAYQVPVYDIIPENTQYVMGSATSNVVFDENHTYPEAAPGSDASDETPYVSWTIPVLFNHGGSVDVQYKVRVKDSVKVDDVIANRATVGGEGPKGVDVAEPTSTNLVDGAFAVSNLVEHHVINPLDDPDFEITKTANPEDGSYIAAGDEITYTITWKNGTDHPIYGFGVRDAIPEHTTFVPGSIVVTGADGKTSTEIKAEAEQTTTDTDECGSVTDTVTESIVWTPVTVFGEGNKSDPENIFRAITGGDINEETHHVYGWRTIKTKIANLKVGEVAEFEVKVDDDYDQLWRATLLKDGRLALLMQILVPNQDGSPNFARANGIIGNYDQKWKDVYALQYELLPGESGSLTFTVKVDEDVEDNTVIKNHATYGAGVYAPPCFDLEYETNETTHIVGSPKLVGTKEVTPSEYAKPGDTLHYKVMVKNEGTARAKNVAIYDRFREDGALKGVAFVPGSWKVSGGDAAAASADLAFKYSVSSEVVGARASEIQPGEALVMEFDVKLVDVAAGDVITNVASFEDRFDGDPTAEPLKNKTNETKVTVDEPRLSVEKTVDVADGTKVEVGDTLTYTIKVTNVSAVSASGIAVYDAIPTYTQFVSANGLKAIKGDPIPQFDEMGNPLIDEETGEQVMAEGPVIAVATDNISLPAGGSKEFTLKVTVDPTLVDDVTITNRATAGFAENPTMPLEFDSKSVVNDAIAPDSALRVVASADPVSGSDVKPGDVITYTVDILNESKTPAKDTAVFIAIPEHVTYVKGSASDGLSLVETGLFGGGRALVANGINLGDHESMQLTFQVKADDTLKDQTVNMRATVGQSRSIPSAPLDIDSNEIIHNVIALKPELAITEDAVPAVGNKVSVGDVITYTFRVSETAGVAANGVAVYDAIPEGTTYVDGSAEGLTEVKSGGRVVALVADKINLAANGYADFSFAVKVNATDVDREIKNQATCGFATSPKLPLEIAATPIDHEVIAVKPGLSITHSSDPAAGTKLAVGDVITYTFKVNETNGASAHGVAVFDEIPANTTYVAGSANGLNEIKKDGKVVALAADNIELAANGSKEFSFRVSVNAVDADVEISNMPTCGFAADPQLPLEISANKIDHEVIVVKPALAITHKADPEMGAQVKVGDEITYTITVAEVNGVAAKGVAVYDAIPANTTFVAGSETGGLRTLEKDGKVVAVIADGIDIAGKASKDFSFKVVVNEVDADTEITNNPTCGFATAPELPLEISATNIDHNIIVAKPGLSVTQFADPESGTKVRAGDSILYTIEVHETNGVKANGVAVFDYIPEGTTYVAGSATGGLKEIKNSAGDVTALAADGIKLTKNGTKVLTFEVTVDETTEDFEITNRATTGFATAPKLPLVISSNIVDHFVQAPTPALRITKSVSGEGSPIAAYDTLEYSFTVLNESSAIARGVAVFDRIPAGTTYVDGSATNGLKTLTDESGKVIAVYADQITIAANRSKTFGFAVTVDGDVADKTIISNRATCGFTDNPTTDLDIVSNETVKNVTVEQPELSIAHSADPAPGTKVTAGDEITYTVKVSETNNVNASGVAVYDEIPAGATYVDGSATGGLEPVTVDGKVIAVAADGIDIAAKGNKTMTFKVVVDATEADAEISNTPTCGFADEATSNLPIAAKTIDHSVVAPKPRLVVTKTSDPKPGTRIGNEEVITYTITVKNDSAAKATGVAVFDKIPAHTTFVEGSAEGLEAFKRDGAVVAVRADGITLGANEAKQFKFAVKTDKALEQGTIVSNRATAGFADDPTDELDVHSNETISTTIAPNVAVTQTGDPKNGATVVEGDILTFTLNVTNDSPAADYDVAIHDVIPAGTSYVEGSAQVEGGEVEVSNGALRVHFDKVDGNANIPVTFKVVVLRNSGDEITNVATWGYDESIPAEALATETNAISYVVDHEPHLTIVKSQEPENGSWIAGGDELVYHITVKNVGRAIAHNVGIYDEAPENTEYVVGSLETSRGAVYVGEDGLLTNIAGDLAAGESVTMSFKVTVDLGFEGTIRNTAMWVSPAADPRTIDVAAPAADADATSDVVAPEGAILGVLGASVPIPDGSYSGVSNEVSAGGKSDPTPEPEPEPTPEPQPEPQPEPTSEPTTDPERSDSNEVIAVVTAPQVRIIKTADPADGSIVKPGTVVTYTLNIDNIGKSNANALYISDVLNDAMTLVDGSLEATGIGATVEGKTIVMRGDLKPAEHATVTFKAKIADDFIGDIINVANWGQAKKGETPKIFVSKSNEVITHVGTTEIELIKKADIQDGDYIARGKTMKYTITATNTGDLPVDLVIDDLLPKGLRVDESSLPEGVKIVDGHIVFEAGVLEKGKSIDLSFDVIVEDDAIGDIVNKATWHAKDSDEHNESNSITVHVGEPLISVQKISDPENGSIVASGSDVQYAVVIRNDGNVEGTVGFADKLPEGMTLDKDSIKAYGISTEELDKITDEIAGTDAADAAAGEAGNAQGAADATPEAAATNDDEIIENDPETDVIDVDILNDDVWSQISRFFDNFISWITGGENQDAALVANGNEITGSLTIGANKMVIIEYSAKVNEGLADKTELSNTAIVTLNGVDIPSENKVIVGKPVLSMVLSADPASGSEVHTGDAITYYAEAVNTGAADASNVAMYVALPEGVTYVPSTAVVLGADGSIIDVAEDDLVIRDEDGNVIAFNYYLGDLASNEGSPTLSFGVTVNADSKGTIKASGLVGDNQTEKPFNAEGTIASNEVSHEIVGAPAISVKKTSDPAAGSKVSAGAKVNYTVTIANTGSYLGTIDFADELPDTLALDADSVKAVIETLADQKAADVDAPEDEPVDTETKDTEAVDATDDSEAVTDGGDAAAAPAEGATDVDTTGDTEVIDPYATDETKGATEINVVNKSTLVDKLVNAGAQDGAIVVDGNKLSGTAIVLDAGKKLTITYTATVADDVTGGQEITNKAIVKVDGGDPIESENKLTVGDPHLVMHKSADLEKVKPGDVVTFDMFISNDGDGAATGVMIYDELPEGLTLIDGTEKMLDKDGKVVTDSTDFDLVDETGDKTEASDNMILKFIGSYIGTVDAGASSNHLQFQALVGKDFKGAKIENIGHYVVNFDPEKDDVSKITPDGDSNKVTIEVSEDAPVKTPAKLGITKIGVDDKGNKVTSFTAGSTQTWKITVTNHGETDATNVRVLDTFGDNLTFESATVDGKTVNPTIKGQSSVVTSANNDLYNAQRSAKTSNGSYEIGIAKLNREYGIGSGYNASTTEACPVPAGTYTVSIKSGYQATFSVSKCDANGSVVSSSTNTFNLGYPGSASSVTVTIPDDGRLTVKLFAINGDSSTQVTSTAARPLVFSPQGAVKEATPSNANTSKDAYTAEFILDKVAGGKSVDIIVKTKVASNAPSKVTNTGAVYQFTSDNTPAATSSATLDRSNYTEAPKKNTTSNETLPKTAAALGALGLVAAGLFFTVGGGREIIKNRKREDDVA